MQLTLDHVPFAWQDHDDVVAEFDRLGLAPEYGGVHDHGETHMSVLGFDDRSYLELIADWEGGDHWLWPRHIAENGGPAAWCIRVPDIAAEAKRVIDAGHPVDGPVGGAREREDGTTVEWDRAAFGTEDRRLLLPFAIQDRTPLSYRVSPTESVAGGPLTGLGQVVLAVPDLPAAVETFRALYRFPRPVEASVPGLGTVASFPGQPVAMVTTEADWLADRLDRFRPGPCTCLVATDDLETARETFPLGDPVEWPEGRAAFFESDLFGRRLGVLERGADG